MAVVSRDRITRSGILVSSLAIHALVLLLMGVHTPTMRQWVSDAPPPPPFEVELYALPPPPPELKEEQAVAPPQAEPVPVPVRPREAPPEPDPRPAPVPRPEPTPEPIRRPEPVPAPPQPQPQPKKKEEPAPAPRPSPVKPREVAREAPPAPIAPLPMAPVPKAAAPGGAAAPGRSGGGSPMPDFGVKPGGDLRDALRRSSVGCANDPAVGLNRREKENCIERLGKDAKDAPFIQAPIAGAKREAFDATAARKDRDRAWREAPMPIGIDPKANAGGGKPAGLGDK